MIPPPSDFTDLHASRCQLRVWPSSDHETVAIWGWNYDADCATGIDLDRETLRDLIDTLMEVLGAMDATEPPTARYPTRRKRGRPCLTHPSNASPTPSPSANP